jgi:hypothetical protein
MAHMCNITTLKSIFISHILLHNKALYTLQKKTVRIVVGAQPRTSYRSLFKKLFYLFRDTTYIFINELYCK